MRANFNVKEQYIGTGLLTDYTFDFKVQNVEDLRVIVLDPSQLLYANQLIFDDTGDHTIYFTTVLNTDGTGKISLVNALGLNFVLMILLADDAPTQPFKFVNNDAFTLQKIEDLGDWLSGQIQRIVYRLGRSIQLPDRFIGNFDSTLPEMKANGIVKVNSTNDGIELKTITELIAASGGAGLPPGGVAGDYPEKQSVTDGDTSWIGGVFSGYSGTFGRFVNITGLRNAFLDIYGFVYAPPTVVFTASGSTSIREKGTTVSSTTLTAVITKTATAIASVVFKQGATVLATQTSGGGIPNGGSSTYSGAITSFSDNTTFSSVVTDTADGSGGGPTAVTSSQNFVFVYPYYYGSGAAGLGSGVSALTKSVIVATISVGVSFTPSGTQKMYFAYLASYGSLTSILDQNGFENLGAFTKTTVNITGLDASSQSYFVYESNSTPVAGTYPFTFKR